MRIELYNPQQAHQVFTEVWTKAKAALTAGHKLTMTIEREKRSNDQNEMFHSIICQIAKQAKHLGATWTAEDWKRLLVYQWAKETNRDKLQRVVPALDGGGIVQLGLQTRNFNKADASEFTEFLLAWSAQNGIVLKDTSSQE